MRMSDSIERSDVEKFGIWSWELNIYSRKGRLNEEGIGFIEITVTLYMIESYVSILCEILRDFTFEVLC
jgi:hypothetical protein